MKKILKISFLVLLLIAGISAILILTKTVNLFTLVVSNRNPDITPIHIEVTIDNRIVFSEEVAYNSLEDILGTGATSDLKSIILFGKNHQIKATTDLTDGSSLDMEFTLEKSNQKCLLWYEPGGFEFEIRDELNFY
ncbi:MAG: hypothetical protein WCT46_05970 [Candidatus Gracilibacteria bacterium]